MSRQFIVYASGMKMLIPLWTSPFESFSEQDAAQLLASESSATEFPTIVAEVRAPTTHFAPLPRNHVE